MSAPAAVGVARRQGGAAVPHHPSKKCGYQGCVQEWRRSGAFVKKRKSKAETGESRNLDERLRQARINQDWRFYFKIAADKYRITELKLHPK
jgi:hypothetical protein